MMKKKEYTLKSATPSVASIVLSTKSNVMSEEKKFPWAKIAKIVAEFVVAIVTAIFASSFCLPYVAGLL